MRNPWKLPDSKRIAVLMVLALIITVPAGVFLLPSHGITPAGHSGNNNVVGTQLPSGHYSYVNSALSNLKATSSGNAAGARYIYNFLQVSGTSYDSQNGLVYASDGFAASITVYNPNTRSVVGFIGGSSYFGPSVYDPANNFLYVIGGSNDVLVINCSSERIVDTIGGIGVAYNNFILSPSCTMTFNAINHDIYVTVSRITSGSFYVINTTSDSVSKLAGSFTGIEGSAYDPQNNLIYLAEFNDSLAIVNATSLGIVGYLRSGFNTSTTLMTSIAYDPAMNMLFVESCAGFFNAHTYSITGWDNLSAFSPANNTLLGTHTLGNDSLMGVFTVAGSIAYDRSSGLLFLGGSQYLWRVNPIDWNVTLISGNLTYPGLFSIDYVSGTVYGTDGNGIFQMNSASGKVSVLTNPLNSPNSITYDPRVNELYVANLASNYITPVNATTNMLGSRIFGFHDPLSIQYDPYNGYLLVTNSRPAVNFSSAEYASGTNFEGTNVSIYDPSSGKILGEINCSEISVDTLNGNLFAANGSNLSILSGKTYQTIKAIKMNGQINDMAFDPSHNNMIVSVGSNFTVIVGNKLITNIGNASLNLINASDGSVSKILYFKGIPATVCMGDNNRIVYVAAYGREYGPSVVAYNSTTLSELWSSNATNGNPLNLLFDPHNGWLYMSDGIDGANGVTVINGTTGAYVGTVFTQLYGYGMAYDPVNQQVYMSASSDGGGYFIVAFSLVLQKQSTNTLVMIEMGLIVILIAVAPLIFLYVHRRIRARK